MKLKIASAAIIALAVLAGCGQSAQTMNDLSLGMTKQNVVGILGTPQSVQAAGNQEVLTYTLSNSWNSQFWNSEYRVVLQNGRVVAYG
jgi:outer membrane protein assembly factor BamE (lipoprotein component of BamABCDE complex)